MALKTEPRSVALALLSVVFISLAQLAMKWGMSQLTLHFSALNELWNSQQYFDVLSDYLAYFVSVLAGLGFYALSMVCWVLALKRLALSVAYPLLSLSYVIVYFSAIALPWIGEAFSWVKALGIVFILAGIVLVFPRANTKSNT
ncbi:putative 4-amino-4-deoxy-L-arabinose-phosphoundecaprenol flippase subunit ArnF [Agarivorans sp. Toyoura001]|uniref:4-amino-4-deoxy-L-arabinose-phosphoundecaprenol flippase subunit ArnF n=1 Tax=Agarivorans sp. Toyoura001 TaxID=2283141 RepID=UPI0010E0733A|nr:4-amino-4-deoxy-L-arabinose-phosphoundecaprenol flippase subunit ArnF [Agarivorans sp. Toyoura001]GDY25246.1 putative 4-amino-4-deoxy-L-arabinose-phosphoundecaprenol flippase subunit ArnF [Agarivorans sp. Toyoura001]